MTSSAAAVASDEADNEGSDGPGRHRDDQGLQGEENRGGLQLYQNKGHKDDKVRSLQLN